MAAIPQPTNRATAAQGGSAQPSSSGGRVVVASKLPMALRIRTFRMVSVIEQRPNSPSKEVELAEANPDTYVIAGTAKLRGPGRTNTEDGRHMRWGYAFTENVPADVWEQWLKDNADQPMVKNKLVFAMPSMEDAQAVARENEKRTTNLEPINPDGDPRTLRTIATASR